MAPVLLGSALDSPVVTIILVIVFSAIVVVALTAIAAAILWFALWAVDRYRGVPNA